MSATSVGSAADRYDVSGSVPFLDLGASHDMVGEELSLAWKNVLESASFVGGPAVEGFEDAWAGHLGRRHAVGVGNGTDALALTLRALGVGPGDEVIVPANTFIATAEAVAMVGAAPRFVDVHPGTLLTTPEIVAAAIGPRTAAVVAVHLYGSPVDLDGLRSVTDSAGVALIEDAAQAHGATWRGAPVGSFGVASCFSFYPGKNLGALGDGGAVVTDSAELAARIRSLGNHGRSPDTPQLHQPWGVNSRLDALQAAVLAVKLPYLTEWVRGRRRAAERYHELLSGHPAVRLMEQYPEAELAHHLFVVRVADRDRVRRHLGELGVTTGVHYAVPCHRQPAFDVPGAEPLPVAEEAAETVLSLPMFPQLSVAQIDRVCRSLCAVVEDGRRV